MTNSDAAIQSWGLDNIADQSGKVIVITGAAGGVGFEAAKALAARGATVVLACRSIKRGEEAADKIRTEQPNAKLDCIALDLGSLKSVHEAADAFKTKYQNLDALINNAGIMVPPFSLTEDGFESQFGTNHLGHFAFTGLLIETLLATPNSRVVNVSSTAHKTGRINFDDLQSKQNYNPWMAYSQSKIANLLFTYELQKRLHRANAKTIAVAAQPGYARTDLRRHSEGNLILAKLSSWLKPIASHSAKEGALPELRAAVDPSVKGSDYFSPANLFELKGPPVLTESSKRSHDKNVQRQLWKVSEELTGVKYAI